MKNKKKFIICKKIGMTQNIDEEGIVTPITLLKLEDQQVLELRTEEKDGYNAVVVGYTSIDQKKLNKPKQGYVKKLDVESKRHIKEFRVEQVEEFKVKHKITLDIFEIKEKVNIRAKTIGKGTAGTTKRHNFSRGPMTHGSKSHRQPGSIGGGTYPGKVFKGQKMPGRMGNEYKTIKNLQVIYIQNDVIGIKGSIPGKANNIVEVYN